MCGCACEEERRCDYFLHASLGTPHYISGIAHRATSPGAVASFLLRHQSDCCRAPPRQVGLPRGVVLSTTKLERGANWRDCEALCDRRPRTCRFFSFSASFRSCVLCSSCALAPVGRYENRMVGTYTSWSKIDPARFRPVIAHGSATPIDAWLGRLQGNYSRRVYGASNRVPPSVHLVWLQLLDDEAFERLYALG